MSATFSLMGIVNVTPDSFSDGGLFLDAGAAKLLIAADVNAVPPSSIEGVDVQDDGKPIPSTQAIGIGALAIGNVKYKVQAGLLKRMIETPKPLYLDFRDAFDLARQIVG